jgi:predicted nucleic acid-binding protein
MMFLDTSVIVAASLPHDPHHNDCIDRLAIAESRGGACALHTLSESFSVLTRLPLPYRVPADMALKIVTRTSGRFKLISLTPSEHLLAIEQLIQQRLAGGMVYDALLLACARKIAATRIYTLNPSHFRRIAPDLAARIHEP